MSASVGMIDERIVVPLASPIQFNNFGTADDRVIVAIDTMIVGVKHKCYISTTAKEIDFARTVLRKLRAADAEKMITDVMDAIRKFTRNPCPTVEECKEYFSNMLLWKYAVLGDSYGDA
jgi:hypothetical protein